MTHVLRREENIFGDNQAFVEEWDFSRANLNEENRLNAITRVASICYQSPKALGSESLYNRLASESGGLPSSSFEFVPVVLDYGNISAIHMLDDININVRKFGEWVIVYDEIAKEDREVLLTNYRAILYDFENRKEQLIKQYQQEDMSQESLADAIAMLEAAYLKFFNTEMECDWIKQHFKVFLYKVDFPTRSQMVRHRSNWQELCISGDSIIKTSQGNRKISEMYKIQEKQKNFKNFKYPKIKSYDFKTQSFFMADIKEIFYTGIKDVFEISIKFGTEGNTRKIKATKDHKFLTPSGWKTLETLKLNEFVAINGVKKYQDKDWLLNQKNIFLEKGMGLKEMSEELDIKYPTLSKWFHKHNLNYSENELKIIKKAAWNKGLKGEESHSFGKKLSDDAKLKISKKHSKIPGETKNGFNKRARTYWEADFRRSKILDRDNYKCVKCNSVEFLELDHIKPLYNFPELAFSDDNIQTLCKKCHSLKSAEELKMSKSTIHYGTIEYINLIGNEETYDIEVDHIDHNYIANSIVVHNSRRYVSGERVKFDFYISENMKPITSNHKAITTDGVEVEVIVDTQDIIDICVGHYKDALDAGVKPQDARRIIPQAGYTLIWAAFQPRYLKNFYKIRLDKHAQWEIRQVAAAMKGIKNEVKL